MESERKLVYLWFLGWVSGLFAVVVVCVVVVVVLCCFLSFSVKSEESKCFKNAREAKAHRGFTWQAIHCIPLKQLLFPRPLLERITT